MVNHRKFTQDISLAQNDQRGLATCWADLINSDDAFDDDVDNLVGAVDQAYTPGRVYGPAAL